MGLCPWRVARQLRRAAAIGVVQVGNLLRVGNYRHRAPDVILLALLGLQGAGWQKQCAESLCCGVLRCCCKVVSRTGEGISRASHESWRSLGWCGGAVSVCMWHFPRWSVRQCVASWASRASHGCISFCLGLALGACLSHLALPVYAYLACAGLLAQLSILLQTFESCALLQRRGCNGRRCNVSEQPNMLLRLGARAHAAKVTPWLVQAVMWEFRGCA